MVATEQIEQAKSGGNRLVSWKKSREDKTPSKQFINLFEQMNE